jgi:phosphate/sulfate permease
VDFAGLDLLLIFLPIFLVVVVLARGTLTRGWRIVRVMGSKMTRLSPRQDVRAETGVAVTETIAGARARARFERLAG